MKVAFVLLLAVCLVILTAATGQGQADRFLEPNADLESKLLADLAARIARAARMSPWGYMGGVPINNMGKRNSELINSLLGLPKVMNDAGK